MTPETFDRIQKAHATGGTTAALSQLIETLKNDKDYPTLFDALLLKHRHELGIPLRSQVGRGDLNPEMQMAYEEAYRLTCREIGGLYLADGDILTAWRYFRAISEPGPVRRALEKIEATGNEDELIEIAYREGVAPQKGFEWILQNYGACRAITEYDQYPRGVEGKLVCAARLVAHLYQELVDNLQSAIQQKEGERPASDRVPELLAGRPWLLEDSYLMDISHLAAVARFSIELEDTNHLRMALELADYGQRVPDTGAYAAGMPVQEHLGDCALYLHALLGERVEEAVAYFHRKTEENAAHQSGAGPAQLLVYLLLRLGRLEDALEMAIRYLADPAEGSSTLCPSVAQLCRLAKQPQRLMEFARERGDLLTFTVELIADA